MKSFAKKSLMMLSMLLLVLTLSLAMVACGKEGGGVVPPPPEDPTIVWTKPESAYKVADDDFRYRAERLETLTAKLAGLVTAKNSDTEEVLHVIVDDSALPARNAETGLLPVGTYAITYSAKLTPESAAESTTYNVEVVAGSTLNYYVNAKTDRGGKGFGVGTGVSGIRVAPENFFTVTGAEMPDSLKNPHDSTKIIDPADAYLLHNAGTVDFTFNMSDASGQYLTFDADGKVSFGYNGIQQDVVNDDNPYAFGKVGLDGALKTMTVPAGSYMLVIGYEEFGNYYGRTSGGASSVNKSIVGESWPAAATPLYDMDGRQFSHYSLGYRQGNIVELKKGATAVTSAYVNQTPYITEGFGEFKTLKGAALNESALIAAAKFYDDNGTFAPDTQVQPAKITVEGIDSVDTSTLGTYSVTYVVADDSGEVGKALRFERAVKVEMPDAYLSYDNGALTLHEVKAVFVNSSVNNQAADLLNYGLFIYDNTYTSNVKPGSVNNASQNLQYAYFVVLGSDGIVKATLDGGSGKLHTETGKLVHKDGSAASGSPAGEALTGFKNDNTPGGNGQVNQMQYFKLKADDPLLGDKYYELEDGDVLLTAKHTGGAANMREFMKTYVETVNKKAGATMAEKSISIDFVNLFRAAPATSLNTTIDMSGADHGITNLGSVLTKIFTDNADTDITMTELFGDTTTLKFTSANFSVTVKKDDTAALTKNGTITYAVKKGTANFEFTVAITGISAVPVA